MKKITIQQLTDKQFISQFVHDEDKQVEIVLNNGKVKMSQRQAILHGLLWHPYSYFNIPITVNEVYDLSQIKSDTISKIQSTQYAHLLKELNNSHIEIVEQLWVSVNEIYRFCHRYLSKYQCSISVLSLVKITHDPRVTKIIQKPIPSELGTKVAEDYFKQQSAELMKLLTTKGAVEHNHLYPLLAGEILNKNQIPQLLMAYGTRSDLDDQMMGHVINESALSGLKTPADLAIESLSAKKTSFYNSRVIQDTQYFARILRLNNMTFSKTYPGHCGSTQLIPITIPKGQGHNFIHKVVYLNGKRIEVYDNNCKEIEGHRVEMVSPTACLYEDGVCEHCAGRTTIRPWSYIPPNIHLGSYAKSKLSSKVSQKVLSAKHLIKTDSLEPKLYDTAKEYLHKENGKNNIILNSDIIKQIKNLVLLVDASNMNHITDLQYGFISPEGFSLLERVIILNEKTERQEELELAEAQFMIHLSEDFLEYMRDISSEIELIDGKYHIPLSGFNTKKPIFSYVVVNDDMVAFAGRIREMINKDIAEYTSVAAVLTDLSNIIYYKIDLNIFWIELIVKSLMPTVIDKQGNVSFMKLREGIAAGSVAAKLGHEEVKRYLQQPSTTFVPKEGSPFDPFFGFGYNLL